MVNYEGEWKNILAVPENVLFVSNVAENSFF